MKKKYIKPALLVMFAAPQGMLCSSVLGVTGTSNMDTAVSDEETDEYLARRKCNEWDDNEDW